MGRAAACVLVALTLTNCSHRFPFIGKWEGHRAMKGTPGAAPYILFTLNTIKLDVLPNGRFNLQDMGVPKQGNITIFEDKALLVVTHIAGKEVESQSTATQESIAKIELKVVSQDKIIYIDPKALDPTPVDLKRIATEGASRP